MEFLLTALGWLVYEIVGIIALFILLMAIAGAYKGFSYLVGIIRQDKNKKIIHVNFGANHESRK